MPKITKWLLIILAIVILLAGGILFYLFGYYLPFQKAANAMPEDTTVILRQQEDGSVLISWPEGINADQYLLDVLKPGKDQPEILLRTNVTEGTSYLLQGMPEDQTVFIRINSAKTYRYPFEEAPRLRFGESPIIISGDFSPLDISGLEWSADPDTKQVHLTFSMPQGCVALLYDTKDGENIPRQELTTGSHTLSYGDSGTDAMPTYDQPATYSLGLTQTGEGFVYYGRICDSFTVQREDLLGTVLELTTTEVSINQFQFTWNETKGEQYEFQQYNSKSKEWTTLLTVPRDGERSYTTGHLTRYSDFRYRVIAVGGQTLPDSDWAATPAESEVSTGASVIFSTIWPNKKLNIYSDPAKTETVGTAPAGKAYCALDLKDGMFYIRYGEKAYGYIDANYCMINLPDMIGNICLYDIRNSYASLFMAHEYELPGITNTVIEGYEKVELSTGNYLVPLLYPTSLKLEEAAFDAIDKGYKLKIYDAYRPKNTTLALYETTESYLEDPIPEQPFTDKELTDMPVLGEGEVLTYKQLITDNSRYALNYFLAKSGSRHNEGTALDLTIISLRTGKELEMQTTIHDLTWYSERDRNNKDATTLSDIMTKHGFGTLVSEWWHYQDNEAHNNLKPEFALNGINPNCWIKDDTGWRYRLDNGKHYYKCTKTIDGVSYTFDGNGYVIDENGQYVDFI